MRSGLAGGIAAITAVSLSGPAFADKTPASSPVAKNTQAERVAQVTVSAKKERPASPPVPGQNGAPGNPIDTAEIGGPRYSEFNFASPLFWISRGQLFGHSAISDTSGSSFIPASDKTLDASHMMLQQVFRYGLTDGISLKGTFEYVTDAHAQTASGSVTSKGWNDPEFDVISRILMQPDDPVYMYLNLGYTPNVIAVNTSRMGRSVASGQQIFTILDATGYQLSEYTFEVTSMVRYHTEGAGKPYAWSEDLNFEAFDYLSDRWSYEVNGGLMLGQTRGGYAVAEVDYYLIPSELQAEVKYRHEFLANSNRGRDTRQHNDIAELQLAYLFDTGG